MSAQANRNELPPARRRRLLGLGLLRSLATTVEALAATVPLFLLLFASAYFTMAGTNPANFSTHSLTRTDALYFTVTTFSTVGFGDITAVSQSARLVVTAQMLLDLLVLGLGIRVFAGAVQLARRQARPAADPGIPPQQPPQQRGGTP